MKIRFFQLFLCHPSHNFIYLYILLLVLYFNCIFLIVSKFVNNFMAKYTYLPTYLPTYLVSLQNRNILLLNRNMYNQDKL